MASYVINDLISWRLIDNQILILDSHLNESAHELNEVGSFIFEKISQGEDLETIKAKLLEHYPNEKKDLEDDFNGFISELKELKLIVSPKS